jgi:carboxylesterase
MDTVTLLPASDPYYFPGGDVGCLLIHGFTGTPFELRWLGEHLHQHGYTVYGPRLAGHATDPIDLTRVHWREWYADSLAAYRLLRANCSKVVVIGLSMGGSLAVLLSAREPVDALVSMSTPSVYRDWRKPLLTFIRFFVKMIPKGYDPDDVDDFEERVKSEQEKRGQPPTGHPSYKAWVVSALPQFFKLLAVMRAEMANVTAPALLIHSRIDQTVPFEDLQPIIDGIGSVDKQVLILEHSSHPVAECVEYPVVFDAVCQFLSEHV